MAVEWETLGEACEAHKPDSKEEVTEWASDQQSNEGGNKGNRTK